MPSTASAATDHMSEFVRCRHMAARSREGRDGTALYNKRAKLIIRRVSHEGSKITRYDGYHDDCITHRLAIRSFDPILLGSFDLSILRSFDPSIHRSIDPSILRSFDPSILRSIGPSIPSMPSCSREMEALPGFNVFPQPLTRSFF